jgi:hypothetical protein
MAKYTVALFDEDTDEFATRERISIDFMPHPGMVFLVENQLLEVRTVQVMFAAKGSIAEVRGDPLLLDIAVKKTRGIHYKRD